MGLNRRTIGSFIEVMDERNSFGLRSFYGLDKSKSFIPTKALTSGLDESKYKVVRYHRFVFSGMQTGRDKCIRIGLSVKEDPFIVSPAYTTFEVVDPDVDPTYFFMCFQSSEMDRLGWFYSDGSIRSNLDWDVFCDIEIELPPIEVQRKYVAIYEAMSANQRAYKQGLDDLKLTCDALVEKLMRELHHEAIGPFIEQCDDRNSKGNFDEDAVRGLSISKQFIETKANLDGVNLCNYKVIAPGAVAYVPVTSRNGGKISIALNESNETIITSAINTVFRVKKSAEQKLLPGYLMLFFGRSEFDRYARFNSWGSARETFDWAEMCDVRIPLPDIAVQQYAIELYQAWRTRLAINERLKSQLKDICPILIRGSIEEASR